MAKQIPASLETAEGGSERTTAKVGIGRKETKEVPAAIGAFDHRAVPNGDTTTWERVYQPREEGEYPYVAVRYAVSCANTAPGADDEFHISRSVTACSCRQWVPNFPHANSNGESRVHSENLIANRVVAHGFDTFDPALSFAKRLMESESVSSRLPAELSNEQRRTYRELKMEGSE